MNRIDGGVLEGGGQILRIAMSLSALTVKPIEIFNIRANREKPGLRAQHLIGISLVRDISSGQLTGDHSGSSIINFKPKRINCGQYFGDTKTAGSTTLLFQISLPCLLFGNGVSKLVLRGGTNAEMAPQIDYTIHVLKQLLEKFGIKFDCNIKRRGYYPKGGGELELTVNPVPYLKPVEIKQFGNLVKITGYSYVAGVLPIKMANLMADSAINVIRKHYPNVEININRVKETIAVGNGSGIVVIAESSTGCKICGSALGKRTVTATEVGESAANDLIEDLKTGAAVDRYTQDQLIIFMALAKGKSAIVCGPLTLHTQTAIHIAQLISNVTFTVTQIPETQQFIIECEGIGLLNQTNFKVINF